MALALVVFAIGRRGLRARDDGSRFWQRGKVVLLWLVLTVISVAAVNGGMKDRTGNNYVNELAGNGIYQFFNAFRSGHLDYAKFYRTLPDDEAFRRVREMLQTPEATYVSDDPRDLTRAIRRVGPEKRLNVVLISVESLSGDYLGTFGNTGPHHAVPRLAGRAEPVLRQPLRERHAHRARAGSAVAVGAADARRFAAEGAQQREPVLAGRQSSTTAATSRTSSTAATASSTT